MPVTELEIDGVRVVARRLRLEDLDALVAYWHDSLPEYLASLGVDTRKLGSREETRARVATGLGHDRGAVAFVAEIEGEIVAYTNVRVIEPDLACAHFHTLRRDSVVRRAAYAFFADVMRAAVEQLHVSQVRFETSVANRGINGFLQSFGLQPRRVRLEHPDGLALAGDFNVYELMLGGRQGGAA
jgi:hypothetical protein